MFDTEHTENAALSDDDAETAETFADTIAQQTEKYLLYATLWAENQGYCDPIVKAQLVAAYVQACATLDQTERLQAILKHIALMIELH